MRTHRTFPALQPWAWRNELLAELVSANHLVAMRIEPVTRGREATVFADFHFSDGERAVTVPLVYVDLAQLDVRELDPLVFPHALLGVVPDARACEIVERVFSDLERRAMAGGFWIEEAIRYGAAGAFDVARSRGFFGAAPLATALPRIAAAVYARRFAIGKHVVAYGPAAEEAAAFLSGVASSCAIAGADADARAWYGEFAVAGLDTNYDLAIGSGPAPVSAAVTVRTDDGADGTSIPVIAPLPSDVMLSFDAADGAATGAFSVTATREPFMRAAPEVDIAPVAGRSAGRIAIAIRPDAAWAPDADRDEAIALAAGLRHEGFTVEVLAGFDELAAFEPDLVHLYGVRPGSFARRIADWASENRKPLAVHALHESPADGGYWGAMVSPYCFSYSNDERSVATYLEMLARRAVEVDGVGAAQPYAPAIAGLAESERVLALADVVLVNSERERAAVEGLRPRRPTFVVPPLPCVAVPGQPVAPWVGNDPFVLVHAPIWPEANQLLLARAAISVGVPMVLAGAVADPAYAERLREFAPDQLILLDEPTPQMVASLYRAAPVVADAAWTTRGHSRIVTAAAFGAAVVCSRNRWLEPAEIGPWTVDPADAASIARGIGEAWDAALRSDPRIATAAALARERLRTAIGAIVATYAKIVLAI